MEGNLLRAPFDAGEFFRCPITGHLTQFHPDQVVKTGAQSADNFLENVEPEFLTVPINPVNERASCRFAALNNFDDAATLQILVMICLLPQARTIPTAGPVARIR